MVAEFSKQSARIVSVSWRLQSQRVSAGQNREKEMTMPDYIKTFASPRSPSYRYQVARQAVTSGQALLVTQADGLTRRMARFLRREKLCGTIGRRRRLVEQFTDLAAALELFREPSRSTAFQLEVRMLARENAETIGNALGIPKATVSHYYACFFCVQPQLDDADFILEYAIRPELKRGPTEACARLRFVSKLFAYSCGLDALQQLVPTGQLNRNKPWCHPLQLVRQLANGTELSQLVDISEARYPSFARDPQAFANWLDQMMKRVRESLKKPLPESPAQRSDWQFMSKFGMGGSYR
jgi:hypothetical protein